MPVGWCDGLIEILTARRRSLVFVELRDVLRDAGFHMRRPTAGSHRTFAMPGCQVIVTVAERRGPLPLPYVRLALRAIEECCEDA